MAVVEMILQNEAQTVSAGSALGCALEGGACIFLQGDLGAGKTTFCRGVLQAFGHLAAVKSPTYTLVEDYQFSGGQPVESLYHFDLYRLGEPEELEYMGIRDYFSPDNVCLVEWPERGAGFLPEPDLTVRLDVAGSGRRLQLSAATARGQAIASRLPPEMMCSGEQTSQ